MTNDSKERIEQLISDAEQSCARSFADLERIEETNTRRILDAFRDNSVALRHFSPTNGYGYDDIGRDNLEKIFADLFRTEAAIVRPHIVSGTAALSLCLFGLLLPGDHLLSASGAPYDTLQTVIGTSGNGMGSLKEMKVRYGQVELKRDGGLDLKAIAAAICPDTRVVMIQRSRGYAWRPTLSPEEIGRAAELIHSINKNITVLVDNCYGEFTDILEPTHHGADVCAGSLIKNPGGGLAPTGGYICGRKDLIDRISFRLTAPGIGREEGSYAGSYRPFYQGLFMAPHAVCQALKTAVLAAAVFSSLGMETSPKPGEKRYDIIQAIKLGSPKKLIAFCGGVQAASPVDANCVPEPWDMPGYEDRVIMAAGTFVAGASIELSADGPMREPYTVYLQGALTYAHGRLALKEILRKMLEIGLIR
ncbi:MAG: methionine gamma-lyase family protein [Clostridia bacterium]|nr:methionine gamma-lyase family protein [Clostridia bacterium]